MSRGWSQADAVERLLAHGDNQMPDKRSVLRRWKSWEAGEHLPSDGYQELLAKIFGTVRLSIFPPPNDRRAELVQATGMDTLEIVTRIKTSDIDTATLEALTITVDRLCSEYAYAPAESLVVEGREWLRRVADVRTGRLTLAQHREILVLAGWLALLTGCLEYDSGQAQQAEATRRAALSLGAEAGHTEIQGWAHEMAAWFAVTGSRNHRGAITAAKEGAALAGGHGVAVQLAAQEAKAWARMGDRREVELALDRGRTLLDRLPYPSNIKNHFVVDPGKYDFYGMDAYRVLGEDQKAATLADEVIRAGTSADGTEHAPMRCAEARITLAVVAARAGDLDEAVDLGLQSLQTERRSVPPLLSVSAELTSALTRRYQGEPGTQAYLNRLDEITHIQS